MNYFLGGSLTFMNSKQSSLLSYFWGFNHDLLANVLFFLIFTMGFLFLCNYSFKSFKVVYQKVELMTGLVPIGLILLQMSPSLSILFINNVMNLESGLNIKVVAHQWYWEYEVTDLDHLIEGKGKFDSYLETMIDQKLKNLGFYGRMDSVDNQLILPVSIFCKFLVTSADVVHSFSLDMFGLKLDSMAGMINSSTVYLSEVGSFTGYCSELCGVGHSAMPISIEIVPLMNFLIFNSY